MGNGCQPKRKQEVMSLSIKEAVIEIILNVFGFGLQITRSFEHVTGYSK